MTISKPNVITEYSSLSFSIDTQNKETQQVVDSINNQANHVLEKENHSTSSEKITITEKQKQIKAFLENVIKQFYNEFIFEIPIDSIDIGENFIVSLNIDENTELNSKNTAEILNSSMQIRKSFQDNKRSIVNKMYQKIPELCGKDSLLQDEKPLIQKNSHTIKYLEIIISYIFSEEENSKQRIQKEKTQEQEQQLLEQKQKQEKEKQEKEAQKQEAQEKENRFLALNITLENGYDKYAIENLYTLFTNPEQELSQKEQDILGNISATELKQYYIEVEEFFNYVWNEHESIVNYLVYRYDNKKMFAVIEAFSPDEQKQAIDYIYNHHGMDVYTFNEDMVGNLSQCKNGKCNEEEGKAMIKNYIILFTQNYCPDFSFENKIKPNLRIDNLVKDISYTYIASKFLEKIPKNDDTWGEKLAGENGNYDSISYDDIMQIGSSLEISGNIHGEDIIYNLYKVFVESIEENPTIEQKVRLFINMIKHSEIIKKYILSYDVEKRIEGTINKDNIESLKIDGYGQAYISPKKLQKLFTLLLNNPQKIYEKFDKQNQIIQTIYQTILKYNEACESKDA